jgi:hypothetical protein
MPTFNYETQSAKLELRVLEMEDTVAALIGVVRTMNTMLGTMNEIVNHYADHLGGLMLALPSTTSRLALWPTVASPAVPPHGGCRCAGNPDHQADTP